VLVGASLQHKITSDTAHRGLYKSIRQFIEFLNHPKSLLNSPVYSVSDISSVVYKTYTNNLARYYPKRSINLKRYGTLRRIAYRFQDKYAGDQGFGKKFKWPVGFAKLEIPKEG